MRVFRSHIIIHYEDIPGSNEWLVVAYEFHYSPNVSWSANLKPGNLSFRCVRNNVPVHRAMLQPFIDVHDPFAAANLNTLANADFAFLDAT